MGWLGAAAERGSSPCARSSALHAAPPAAPRGLHVKALGGSGLHQAKDRDDAVMELAPRTHLWIEPPEDELAASEGDGILWLVAALAQVCEEYVTDCMAKLQSAARRPPPPVPVHRTIREPGSQHSPGCTASRGPGQTVIKLVLHSHPRPLNITKVW